MSLSIRKGCECIQFSQVFSSDNTRHLPGNTVVFIQFNLLFSFADRLFPFHCLLPLVWNAAKSKNKFSENRFVRLPGRLFNHYRVPRHRYRCNFRILCSMGYVDAKAVVGSKSDARTCWRSLAAACLDGLL